MKYNELVPDAAHAVFGELTDTAAEYVELLRGPGMERGLIGPREGERIWERHVLNSTAVTAELGAVELGDGITVTDIGSGAGLPGIPLALCRPDLSIVLVEPLLRRSIFLEEAIEKLQLGALGIDVRVIRGRAEDEHVLRDANESDAVTARAVAPLAKLAGWCSPLIRTGGQLIALKGESAAKELERDGAALARCGLREARFSTVEVTGADPTYLITASKMPKGSGTNKKRQRDKLGTTRESK